MADDPDLFSIMVASDSHLGFLDKDAVRGTDSFAAFEEVLVLAKKKKADFVLLAGDLFHDNKPSRRTLHKSLKILRKYALGDDPVGFQVISDQAANFPSNGGQVNYENPHVAVSLPVFSIHGNHDDPTREGGVEPLCALDLLAEANLVNYFGRSDRVDSVEVHPVLLKKGDTRVALYGLGSMRDERLNRMWQQKKVKFLRPTACDEKVTYFSIFVLHQNRDVGRGRNTCVHESMIPEWFDLVIWGHEHECQIKPRESAVGTFRVCQPGSGVGTSLVEGEAKPKHCGLLQVRGQDFRLVPTKLTCQRPFVCDEVALADVPELEDQDAYDDDRDASAAIADALAARVEALIAAATEKQRAPRTEGMLCPLARPEQVLVRLKVDHTGFATVNNAKFGGRFVGRVANPNSLLHFSKQKKAPDAAKKAWQAAAAPVEEGELDAVKIEDLVQGQLDRNEAKLNILGEAKMNEALDTFVAKADASAFAELVDETLRRVQRDVARSDGVDDEDAVRQHVQGRADDQRAKASGEGDDDDDDAAAPPPRKPARRALSSSDDDDDDEPPPPKRSRAKAPAKPAARGRKRAPSPSDDDDDDEEEEEEEAAPAPAPRPARASRAKKPAAPPPPPEEEEDDDDDVLDDEEDEDEAPPPPKRKRASPAKKAPARKNPWGGKSQDDAIDIDGWDD